MYTPPLPLPPPPSQAEQERAEQEQLRLSQQREEHAQLQEEIQRLQSEVTKVTNCVMSLPTTSPPLLTTSYTPLARESAARECQLSEKSSETSGAASSQSHRVSSLLPFTEEKMGMFALVVDTTSDQAC